MFERFTDRARRVLVLAQEEARLLSHSFIGTEHLLLGLIHEGDGLAAKVLESFEVSLETVREKVEEKIGPAGPFPTGSPPFTPRAKKVLELALREALALGHNYIGTEHILLGLIGEGEGVAAAIVTELGVDLEQARQRVISMIAGATADDSTAVSAPRSDWLQFPTKIVGGPVMDIDADGITFSVIGVLVYDAAVQVVWRLSGIPKPIADLIRDSSAFSVSDQQNGSVAYVRLSDDQGTNYALGSATAAAQSDEALVGRSQFIPQPPDTATVLAIEWQGGTISVEL